MKRTGRGSEQAMIRLPDGMRDALKAAAETNNRSMNAEIVDRLERSFAQWPRLSLPPLLVERAMRSSEDRRQAFEEQLDERARELALSMFPSGDVELVELVIAFYNFMDGVPGEDVRKANRDLLAILKAVAPSLRPEAQESLAQMNDIDQVISGALGERSETEHRPDGDAEPER